MCEGLVEMGLVDLGDGKVNEDDGRRKSNNARSRSQRSLQRGVALTQRDLVPFYPTKSYSSNDVPH